MRKAAGKGERLRRELPRRKDQATNAKPRCDEKRAAVDYKTHGRILPGTAAIVSKRHCASTGMGFMRIGAIIFAAFNYLKKYLHNLE
jgi:hypothetical protein